MTNTEVIQNAAVLRGRRKFAEAIELVEANFSGLEDWARVPALLQAFYAAREASDAPKAKELASRIAGIEPMLPSIQEYLD